jgi:N6-adenosine-specific RNA methylase IME4
MTPDKHFSVLVADPPWLYNHSRSKSRSIEAHYEPMSLEAICAVPVQEFACVNAVLFLWITAPKLLTHGPSVLDAWGFKYKTCHVWDKVKMGMGYWARGRHEILLIATRGQFSPPPPHQRPESVWTIPRIGHSRKPPAIMDWIDEVWPRNAKLELFARVERPGWECWGSELGHHLSADGVEDDKDPSLLINILTDNPTQPQ